MNKLSLAALFAASLILCVQDAANAADYRELNHQAIEAMRAGQYAEAEKLFEQALEAYTPEASCFDLSIKNNLAVLRQNESYKGLPERKGSPAPALTLSGQVKMTASDRLLAFAQPYFDKIATQKFQRITSVPMKAASIRHYKKDEVQLRYGAEIIGERSFEIIASIQEAPDGSYKLMDIRADVYRKSNLSADALVWNSSLFNDKTESDAHESVAARKIMQAKLQENEERNRAEIARIEQEKQEDEARLAREQEENERIAAENKRIAEENERITVANATAAQAAATAAYIRANPAVAIPQM